MTFIDFHVHIDHYPDPSRIASEYEQNKVYALFVTNLPELFEKHLNAFGGFKYVRLAIGYHPDLTGEFPFDNELFDRLVKKTNYIGEVGIDLSQSNKQYYYQQLDNFSFITQEKYNRGKIYSIHSSGAEDEVLEILLSNKVKNAVFHWYSGKVSTLEKIIENKYMFSVNPRMLKSKKGQKILSLIPKELMLFETDAPFVKFNNKLVTPKMFSEMYNDFDQEITGFSECVLKNFKRLLISRELHSKLRTDKTE